MKKRLLFFVILLSSIFIAGCGKTNESEVVKQLNKKITNAKAYHLTGTLEMMNNEDVYTYSVDVSYKKDDKFRVSLKNQTNNHEQIILRNADGVYVLTPSLNKSFKFQSEWPYNNSQSYLLQTLLSDIKNDKNRKFKKNDNGYVLTTTVTYSNNKDLTKQNIYIDKNFNITEVHVLDKDEQVQIKMKFDNIDLKATIDDKQFALKNNMTSAEYDDSETTSKLEDIIYPMYMPANTRLTSQDKVTSENGERIILTFAGDNPFMFIQETANREEETVNIPMYGDPVVLATTVAAVSDSSVTWNSNGIDYYVVSESVSIDELMNIATSISVMPVGK